MKEEMKEIEVIKIQSPSGDLIDFNGQPIYMKVNGIYGYLAIVGNSVVQFYSDADGSVYYDEPNGWTALFPVADLTTLRSRVKELEESKENLNDTWLRCCNDLERQIKALELELTERSGQLESAFVLHRSLEWKLNAANKRIEELEKPVVVMGEPLRRGNNND